MPDVLLASLIVELISPRLFWILLAATVAVLLAMIARLVRHAAPAEPTK